MIPRAARIHRRSPHSSRGKSGGPLAGGPGGAEDDRRPARPWCIMTITALGDQAVFAAFAVEADALRFAAAVRAAGLPGVVDVVTAYFTVAVFYDLARTRYARLAPDLERLHATSKNVSPTDAGRAHVIPCCYVLGPDLA